MLDCILCTCLHIHVHVVYFVQLTVQAMYNLLATDGRGMRSDVPDHVKMNYLSTKITKNSRKIVPY